MRQQRGERGGGEEEERGNIKNLLLAICHLGVMVPYIEQSNIDRHGVDKLNLRIVTVSHFTNTFFSKY